MLIRLGDIMNKILFLGAGSTSDPGFKEIVAKAYLKRKGIKITSPTVIESCHGNYDLMNNYSHQIQHFVDMDYKAVGVLQGGLYFALPSIQATQTTCPIISCPLDKVAYQGFMVPSGTAVIGTVGVEKKEKDLYQIDQRIKAVCIAQNIFDLTNTDVAIMGSEKSKTEIQKELEKFEINTSRNSDLILNSSSRPSCNIGPDEIQLWSDSKENPNDLRRLNYTEKLLSDAPHTLQVRGNKNLAYYAAKIISLQRPNVRKILKEMGEEKRKSYPERDLVQELGD